MGRAWTGQQASRTLPSTQTPSPTITQANTTQTEDFSVLKPDGSLRKGREDAAKAIQEIYGPFASHNHRPNFLVTWETKDGYAMSGEADVFFNLHGVPAGNESDGEGGKWHGHISAAFRFDYVREESDIKLKATRIFSDASPALKLMLQNKQIDGNALVGILGA